MYKKYSIRTLSELYELIRKSEMAGELTTKEQAKAIFDKATYEVLKKFVNDVLYGNSNSSKKEDREWLIKNILLILSEEISLNAYLTAKYHKKVTATDAETAIKALAEADTREEMKCILENLSIEELEKVEKTSVAEFVKKTNLINVIISYVEYFHSQK